MPGTPSFCIPAILGHSPPALRTPLDVEPPTPRGACQLPPCWRACPPTYHAFGWIYRASLMRLLTDGMAQRSPPLDPLDIWVWEAMATHRLLRKALCLREPLVAGSAGSGGSVGTAGGCGMTSVKEAQDDPAFLQQLYKERGYGTDHTQTAHEGRPHAGAVSVRT